MQVAEWGLTEQAGQSVQRDTSAGSQRRVIAVTSTAPSHSRATRVSSGTGWNERVTGRSDGGRIRTRQLLRDRGDGPCQAGCDPGTRGLMRELSVKPARFVPVK